MEYEIFVKDAMTTEVVVVSPNATVEEAAQILKKEKIGSVVVFDKEVKGILTSSDIVYRFVAERRGNLVKDIMTKDVIKTTPDTKISEAAQKMVVKNIEKLLVFENDEMIGIITANDILTIEPTLFEILIERMKIDGIE